MAQASSSQFPSNSQTSTVQLTSSSWRTHSVSGSQTTSMPFTQSSSQTSSTQVISNLQTSPTQPISGPQITATQSTSAQQISSTQSSSGSQTRSTSGPHVQTDYTQPHSATMPPTHGTSSLFPVTTPMPSVLGKDIKLHSAIIICICIVVYLTVVYNYVISNLYLLPHRCRTNRIKHNHGSGWCWTTSSNKHTSYSV